MIEIYRIHFGYSKRSKYFPQAVELAQLAYKHEILGEGKDVWHIVTLTEEQVDLMAPLYSIAVKLPSPKIYGADIQYTYAYCLSGGTYNYVHASEPYKKRVYAAVERLQKETGKSIKDLAEYIQEKYLTPMVRYHSPLKIKLRRESRIDYIDPDTQSWVRAKHKSQEPILYYRKIRRYISKKEYAKAVDIYYSTLGDRLCGELTSELIYLKRLAQLQITGRDLFTFRSESSLSDLILSNLSEYVSCIDTVLERLKETGRKSPLDILNEYAPTMEQVIEERKHDWHMGVYLWDGEFTRDFTQVALDTFSAQYDSCPEGRLFDRYPDQVQHCRMVEYIQDPKYKGLWTLYSPSDYQTKILDRGLHVNGIEAYRHNSWQESKRLSHKEPDFTTVQFLKDISKENYTTHDIHYTGRTHTISGQIFYEIDLQRDIDGSEEIGNPFSELVEEILREAENDLRENHGLPRIGEGWVSETRLYRMTQSIFPDAQQHATPDWLKPQHLDVFVPSRRIAFEYQGKQHFEPIDFFGGQVAYAKTVKRDEIKAQKCKSNGVLLIQWQFDEPIKLSVLIAKLQKIDVVIESEQ